MNRHPFLLRIVLALAGLAGLFAISRRPRPAIAFGMASHLLLTSICLRRNSNLLVPVIKQFCTQKKAVWLTLDDGPTEDTEAMLEVLAKHSALASFFVIGKYVEAHPELARKILDAGHSLENHTYSHPQFTFWTLPPCCINREIKRTSQAILQTTGKAPRYFRAPVGMSNPFLYRLLCKHWLRPIGWSADGCDGRPGRDLKAACDQILSRVRPGAILLFHQGIRTGRVEALDYLLTELGRRGYQCILPTNDEL